MCRGKCTIPRGIRQHVWLDWVISFLLLINFIEYLKFYTAGGWVGKRCSKHTHYTNVAHSLCILGPCSGITKNINTASV